MAQSSPSEQMAKTGGGSIVNISSIMGFVGGTGGHPAYHASKGAVRIYSKAAAVRYGPLGVRVNTVHPGYIQIRVTDIDAALRHYVDRVGLHEVSRGPDGRAYLHAWDEFDRHSVVLRPAETPGMDYVGFKVASEVDLNAFAHRIETAGRPAAGARAAAQLCRADRPPCRVVCRDGIVR